MCATLINLRLNVHCLPTNKSNNKRVLFQSSCRPITLLQTTDLMPGNISINIYMGLDNNEEMEKGQNKKRKWQERHDKCVLCKHAWLKSDNDFGTCGACYKKFNALPVGSDAPVVADASVTAEALGVPALLVADALAAPGAGPVAAEALVALVDVAVADAPGAGPVMGEALVGAAPLAG